jgi:serine phosphatase RsbU (regulator of sigma subunit)
MGQSIADSLKMELKKLEPSDTNRIELLFSLADKTSEFNEKLSIYNSILKLAKNQSSYHRGDVFMGMGMAYHNHKDRDSAIVQYYKAIPLLNKTKNNLSLGKVYNNLALLNRKNTDSAIVLSELSLKYKLLSKNEIEIGHGYLLCGDFYDQDGIFTLAMEHYLGAARLYEKNNHLFGLINVYNNLAILHGKLEEDDKRISYCKKTIETIIESGDSSKYGGAINNLGNAYMSANQLDKAIETHLIAVKHREQAGPYQRGESFYNLGDVYLNKNEPNKALKYVLKAHDLFTEINSAYALLYSNHKLGAIYVELKQYSLASKHLNEAHSLGEKFEALPELKDIYKSLSVLYEKQNNFKKSLKFHQLFLEAKDSLYSMESLRSTKEMSVKFETEMKELRIDGLEKESKIKQVELEKEQLQSKSQKRVIWSIGIGLLFSIIFTMIAIRGYVQKKRANKIITQQKEEVEQQKEIIEEAHQEITDSITYAKRIQSAILPPTKVVKEYLQESFILYKPKDIVAGDFYWMEHKDDKVLFAAADCTGHGVPGAMVSVVCNNGLNRAVREHGLSVPGEILTKTREIVIQEFEKSDEEVKDGMDIALCSLEGNKLEYAGANNPLWIIRNGEIMETKANKQPIGKFDNPEPYTTHTFKLQKGDSIYIFSDGYVDQFGGEKGKKFKARAFRELLLSIQDKSMEEQKTMIDNAFEDWKGSLEQIDDVCVIGVRF